jgi:hypothetical protein
MQNDSDRAPAIVLKLSLSSFKSYLSFPSFGSYHHDGAQATGGLLGIVRRASDPRGSGSG